MNTTKKSIQKAIDEIESYIKDGCQDVAMSKDAVVTPVRDQSTEKENRLLDEVRGLKEELNATKIRYTHTQIQLLRSTPKKNIFPPGTRGSQAKQETNGSAVANEEYSFQLGDPVWAKMKGFCAWPGKIEIPPENLKRPITKKVVHCVFFF